MISLSNNDKDELMSRFPNIELCYESNIEHNKVSTKPDYYALIPKGRKCLLWTTYFKEHLNATFALELFKGDVNNIYHVNIPSMKEMAYGTIFYGTIFYKNHFCIETCHYYKGRNVEKYSSQQQLELCHNYMQLCYKDNLLPKKEWSFKLGLPYMCVDISECIRMKNIVPYSVFCIQHRKYHWNHKKLHFSFIKESNLLKTQQKENYISFEVIADNQNDVYNCYYGKNSDFYSVLYIPDIKTSVMMNKLYRNIKENINLDALEESDDEDDFENINDDKYLLEDKKFIIDCAYNGKFRKWYPVRISKNKYSVLDKNLIKNQELQLAQNRKRPASNNYKKYKY